MSENENKNIHPDDRVEDTSNEKIAPVKKSKFFRLRKYILRFAIFLLLFFTIISAAFVGLSQSKWFRTTFYGWVLNIVNDQLEGKIEASDIKIMPFDGIQIWDLRLLAAGDTLAYASKVHISYSFSPILSNYLYIKSVELVNPSIKLIKNIKDGTWNFTHLSKPSTDTSSSKKLNWIFDLQKLEIINGKMLVFDPTPRDSVNKNFDFFNLYLKNLNVKLKAKAEIMKDKIFAQIDKFEFDEVNNNIKVKNLSLQVSVKNPGIEISHLRLLTNVADVNVTASSKDFNIYKSISDSSIKNSIYNMSIALKNMTLRSLNKFVSSVPPLDELIDLKLNASGKPNNLDFNNLIIDKGKSHILISGKFREAIDSKGMQITATISNSEIVQNDFKKILEYYKVNLPHLDILKIDNISAVYSNDSLFANLKIETPNGKFKGPLGMGFHEKLSYKADLIFEDFNLGGLLENNELISRLNGEANLTGSGTDFQNMNSKVILKINNSDFNKYNIGQLNLNAQVSKGARINIDTLSMALRHGYKDSTIRSSDYSKVNITGNLDFANLKNPKYNLIVKLDEFNMAKLFQNEMAPEYVESTIKIDGAGFNPDEMNTILNAQIDNMLFKNRALMPFSLDVDVKKFDDGNRSISIKSNLFEVDLTGSYSVGDFAFIADYPIGELITLINKKVFGLMSQTDKGFTPYIFNYRKHGSFKPFNMNLKAKLKDITPIAIAIQQDNLSCNAEIDMTVNVDENSSIMDLKSLKVEHFYYKNSSANISLNPMDISIKVDMNLKDSIPNFEEVSVRLEGHTESLINSLTFDKPYAEFFYRNDKMTMKMSTVLNSFLDFRTHGLLTFNPENYEFKMDSLKMAFINKFYWNNSEQINMQLTRTGLDIKNIVMHRNGAEKIQLSGLINPSYANDFKISVNDFPVNEINYFIPDNYKRYTENLSGTLKNFSLTINDSLNAPTMSCKLETGDLMSKDSYLGWLSGSADYSNKNLTGYVRLQNTTSKKEILNIGIKTLPVDLAIYSDGDRFIEGRQVIIITKAYDLPLAIVGPFIPPVITNMKGTADATINVTGTKHDIFYGGQITAKKANFLMVTNNLYYSASGVIDIVKDDLTLKNVVLENNIADLPLGRAYIDGTVKLKNFDIEGFDLYIKSKGIKLLGMQSIKNMPTLYGDFIVASGKAPIRFYGSFTDPYLSGDVSILKSRINMPAIETRDQLLNSALKYEIKGSKIFVKEFNRDSIDNALNANGNTRKQEEKSKSGNGEKSFADIIHYDMYVTFVNPMEILMELNRFGQVYAVVTTKDPNTAIHYFVNPEKKQNLIIGDLILKQNSTMKFIKVFNIGGNVSFPTGSIDNPGLNLKATYRGQTNLKNRTRNFTVDMYIAGTKNNPLITFDYSLDGESARGDSTKIRENALFLLGFGMTKTEFEAPSSGGKPLGVDEIGASTVAAMLSKSVTEMLQGSFISSADIDLQGGSFQNAKLKLTGQIGGITWNVGGTVADFMNNNEFTAEIPVGMLLYPDLLKSLFFQFSKSVNPPSNVSRNQKDWEVKLKFDF
jgi:hypothetical protein